ncbi:hypothetical protein [Kitasatospora indigofera]
MSVSVMNPMVAATPALRHQGNTISMGAARSTPLILPASAR